jgi:hypothetical protein
MPAFSDALSTGPLPGEDGGTSMSWSEQVFNYCERGLDGSFWAEPFNALSNGAFLAAAAAAAVRLYGTPSITPGRDDKRLALWGLIGLTTTIGIGSFLFHTFATRWALIADVGPITVFMIAYLSYALRVFLGLGWPPIAVILPVFLLSGSAASAVTCGPTGAAGTEEPCLNGSLGYAPALVSLWIVGLIAMRRGLAAGRALLAAASVFLVSMALRTVDRDVCDATHLLGHVRGTHSLWHALNALTLHLLLQAAVREYRSEGGG